MCTLRSFNRKATLQLLRVNEEKEKKKLFEHKVKRDDQFFFSVSKFSHPANITCAHTQQCNRVHLSHNESRESAYATDIACTSKAVLIAL